MSRLTSSPSAAFKPPLRAWLLCGSLVFWLVGCERPPRENPADAYVSFSHAIQKGDYQGAYAALSSSTRENLADRAKKISQASGGAVKDDPATLFFANIVKPQPLTEVKVIKQEGDRATVSATSGGVNRTVTLIREPKGWKVDLSDLLKAS
jgi:hypothetical protein